MSDRISFYLDEHVDRAVAKGLRLQGVDTLTVPEARMMGASDEEHLIFARQAGRVLFTKDQDFLALHGSGWHHAGIVYAPRTLP